MVGMVTIDVVEGSQSLGGSITYAAAAASAIPRRRRSSICIVTAAAPETDLSSLEKFHTLHKVPTNTTLTFEHSYTFWGNHRKLKVTAIPDRKLSLSDVPLRCRGAPRLLLGPLVKNDVDVRSFLPDNYPWWWLLFGWKAPSLVGIMAQDLQRELDKDGKVAPLKTVSPALKEALSPAVVVFLSDVETESFTNGTLEALAAQSKEILVTRGPAGADRYFPVASGVEVERHVAFPINAVVDTNGAGDTFAALYMIAEALGHPSPTDVANWGGAMAVSKRQNCKPWCIREAIKQAHRQEGAPLNKI